MYNPATDVPQMTHGCVIIGTLVQEERPNEDGRPTRQYVRYHDIVFVVDGQPQVERRECSYAEALATAKQLGGNTE